MDEGLIRAWGTLFLFVAYVAFAAWVWSPGQKARFEEASWLPLRADDDAAAGAGDRDGGTRHD